MLTAPTLFSEKISQGGYIDGKILQLTDGVDTFLLGNVEIEWTDSHVYNVIDGDLSWTQTIDDITNDWSRVVVEVNLTNIWYRKDSTGEKVRLSELLDGISGQVAKLYLINNPEATALTDCLEQFIGVFSKIISYDETSLRIELLDSAGFLFKQLATDSMKDVIGLSAGSEPSKKSRLLKAPLVYGKFQRDTILMGLSKVPLLNQQANEFMIATHEMKLVGNLFIVNGQDVPPFLVERNYSALSTTASPDNNPVITWIPDDSGNLITSEQFFLNPNNDDRIDPLDDIDKYGDVLNNYLAIDTDTDTKSKLVMDEETFQTVEARVVLNIGERFDFHQIRSLLGYEIYEAIRLKEMLTQSEVEPKLFSNYVNFDFNSAIDFVENKTIDSVSKGINPQLNFFVSLIYNNNPDIIATISSQTNSFALFDDDSPTLTPPEFDPVVNTSWQQFGFLTRANLQDSNRDYGVILGATVTGLDYATFGDIPETWLFEIGEVFLTIVGEFTAQADEESFSGINAPYAFVACEGRPFGSWIDDASWSNNFNEGELVQNPSMIIASLLIDEGGKSVSDLDTTTFDNALSLPCVHRINIIDEELTMKDVIKTLSNQSFGTFVWTASDKGRFIPLRHIFTDSPTTDITIRFDDLLDGFISVTDTDSEKIVNHLTIKSRWLEEESRFVDEDTYTNAVSIAKYGERKQILEFKQINSFDNSATFLKVNDWLALHFIDADEVAGTQTNDGFWAKQRGVISLTTVNHKCAENEVGDIITIDPTTVDPHLLYKTSSWSGFQFMILSITQSGQFTTIEAKQIADSYNMINGMRQMSELT